MAVGGMGWGQNVDGMHWEFIYFVFRISISMNWRWLISQNKWEQHFWLIESNFKKMLSYDWNDSEFSTVSIDYVFFWCEHTSAVHRVVDVLLSIVLRCIVLVDQMFIKYLCAIEKFEVKMVKHGRCFLYKHNRKENEIYSNIFWMVNCQIVCVLYWPLCIQMKIVSWTHEYKNEYNDFVTFDGRPIFRKSLVNSNISSKTDTY